MGVICYSPPDNDFTHLYISARKKENRFYTVSQIAKLPDLEKAHTHYDEWQLRKKSAARFIKYLESKNKPLKILDIGCGNGWFSHLMSNVAATAIIGIDINMPELELADETFKKPNLDFAYADLFENTALHSEKFDIVVFNSCLQYFENVPKLLAIVNDLLSDDGEIHIIDTPIYNNKNIDKVKQRTKAYYENLGFPDMAKHYFHHQFADFGKFRIMYIRSTSFLKYLKKDSPFPWILIEVRR
ncbi:MAG TPA: class I SAM-dependent methyltransferase [Flavobacterium sp.]|nr:class I SAM-dependent methyltransferase [Flavobacterium sp.]